jgi:uncharacterized protein
MGLQQQITQDMRDALKAGDTDKVSTLRFIMGEFTRGLKTELDDNEVVRILRKTMANELSLGPKADQSFVKVLEQYVPKQADREAIQSWIEENVDFSTLKSPKQAIGLTKKHFGETADGQVILEIIDDLAKE